MSVENVVREDRRKDEDGIVVDGSFDDVGNYVFGAELWKLIFISTSKGICFLLFFASFCFH